MRSAPDSPTESSRPTSALWNEGTRAICSIRSLLRAERHRRVIGRPGRHGHSVHAARLHRFAAAHLPEADRTGVGCDAVHLADCPSHDGPCENSRAPGHDRERRAGQSHAGDGRRKQDHSHLRPREPPTGPVRSRLAEAWPTVLEARMHSRTARSGVRGRRCGPAGVHPVHQRPGLRESRIGAGIHLRPLPGPAQDGRPRRRGRESSGGGSVDRGGNLATDRRRRTCAGGARHGSILRDDAGHLVRSRLLQIPPGRQVCDSGFVAPFPGGKDYGARRPFRRGQVDDHQADSSPLRTGARRDSRRRPAARNIGSGHVEREDCGRQPGRIRLQCQRPRQYRVRQARRHRPGDRRRGQAGERARIHRHAPARLSDEDWRSGRPAFDRPVAATDACARDHQGSRYPHSRRGD